MSQTLAPRHGGMSMDMGSDSGMDMGKQCKMKMYWNWYTIDACFLSESWHITSKGMFAGSCIGVVLLVMAVELLRRFQREYDRFIVRQWKANENKQGGFKPTLLQQALRALVFAVQVGAGYIIMLLVMYYNGYIFFCILIGALLGYFIFGNDNITDGMYQDSGGCYC